MPCARAATWRKTASGSMPSGPARGRAELDLLLQARDADLEELVEVRRDDAEEAQPLEQRHRLVLGLREHAAVEFERLQLAVEEMLGRQTSDACRTAFLVLRGHGP